VEVLIVVDVPSSERAATARVDNDAVAAEVGARVIYRVGRRGFGSALRRGFDEATGDVMIPFMADGCDDPGTIPRMVEALARDSDVVVGSRYIPGGGIVGDTAKQRVSKVYSMVMRWVGGPDVHDVSNAFKAYRRLVVDSVDSVGESFDVSVELAVKAARAGYRFSEIPTVWTNRQLGSSNFHMGREVRNYWRWLVFAAGTRVRSLGKRPSAVTRREVIP